MESLTEKTRLLAVLKKQPADRPPVICPGGMMNAAVVEVVRQTGINLPEAHGDPELMAGLARAVRRLTGFENFGVPFCMTVEAEALGSAVDYGTLACEPKIAREAYNRAAAVNFREIEELLAAGRVRAVAGAVASLAAGDPDVPVLACLTGPISLAASLVDPGEFLKDLRRDRENAHRVLDYVTSFLERFALLLASSGAAAITVADPTATGEILGPSLFNEYALPYLRRVVAGVHRAGLPVIVHICGNVNKVKSLLPALQADALSVDAMINLTKLKGEFPEQVVMGNISTYLLQNGGAAKITGFTGKLLAGGIDIIAPACGLSTSTPLANIQAMTATVKHSLAPGGELITAQNRGIS
ncbi:uroporphyrinogen decarboxylase [Moorella thermoacetica]|uniref:Uroporphyrinogen decarboxylase n=1 Tax=Neomoorella thermoacetica TaxID=1525 RepID=A0A1J5P002_NEOTH|nr:uroporphyrinogen decarboxylase [Moorella thermoacetica]